MLRQQSLGEHVMVPRTGKYRFSYTLAGLLSLVTIAAVLLSLGRALGFVAVALYLMSPMPTIGYLLFVRHAMRRFDVDLQSRSIVANFALKAGLAVAVFVSLAIFAGALGSLNEQAGDIWSALEKPTPSSR